MFDLNRDWRYDPKRPRQYKERRFDNNRMSLFAPWYVISQTNTNFAFIFNGKQIVVKKIPGKRDYFIDKDLGMFEVIPSQSFSLGKATIYFYDLRNQNPLNPGLLNELYQWANNQGLYKIRKVDVEHAIRMRIEDGTNLKDAMIAQKRETRKFMARVLESIRKKNDKITETMKEEQGDPDSDEYKLVSEYDSNFIIVQNLFDNGYIDGHQAGNLNHKLTLGKIKSTDDLLHEIDTFTDVYVTKPISNELERVLDDFHTYKPREIIGYIKDLSKIRGGISKLRTKAVINWFPSMYILFGILGIGILYVLYSQYGGDFDPSSLIPQP